ncbi:transcriptional regulator family: Fungal Specific TF [Paecilomyces variotii]|nr:transcriptional regulator family: Fungal Specific TF [Paecilomyces variotii]
MSPAGSKGNKNTPARKKACRQCTKAKARCGHERPRCSRCQSRNLDCQYTTPTSGCYSGMSPANQTNHDIFHGISTSQFGGQSSQLSRSSVPDRGDGSVTSPAHQLGSSTLVQTDTTSQGPDRLNLDFSHLDLVSIADSTQIRNRWLESFFPSDNQIPKTFLPYTVQFLSCVLASYPKYMLRDREMERLIEERESYGQMELLAASQAYLIYVIMAYFSPAQGIPLVDSSTIVHLQEFSSRLALGGLISAAELMHTRPSWESWIVASAKRRVIFASYLFNNVFNSTNQVPVYLAEELGDLPVPGNKLLWEAKDRVTWEKEYDRHLSLWEDGDLRTFELWRSPETGSPNRRKRIHQWLRSVDEFGMMLFATCAHLHGC